MRKLLACLLFAFPLFAQEADHEIHQELRAVLTTVQNAINSGNYDAMLPVISDNIRATTITQEVMSNRADVSAYFKKWFGPGGFLKKLDMHLNADALTELSATRHGASCAARAIEKYTLADGAYRMHTRWTATVVKEATASGACAHPLRDELPRQPDPRRGEAEGEAVHHRGRGGRAGSGGAWGGWWGGGG